MRKLKLILITFIIIFGIMPLNTYAAKKTSIKKMIMFGDSYGKHPYADKTHWDDYIQLAFHISDKNAILKIRGESGFTMKKESRSFVEKLRKMKADNSVNIILIVGGVTNDMGHSEEYTKSKMTEFSKIAKKKFPNAKIYYAIPNWTKNGKKKEKALLERKKFCNTVAKSLHWKVLKKTEKCLYKTKDWYEKDLHHPNTKGQKIIGKALVADLKKAGLKKAKKQTTPVPVPKEILPFPKESEETLSTPEQP